MNGGEKVALPRRPLDERFTPPAPNMATATNQFRPDYAVPPGWIIKERLAAQRISHAEFARRCGRSAKLISEIVSGKAPIAPKIALQFEKVMGLDASIWVGIEADYRLHRERQGEPGRPRSPRPGSVEAYRSPQDEGTCRDAG